MADAPAEYRTFAAIAAELYGDVVEPHALWEIAKANDPSEVHIDGAPKKAHSNTARALVLGGVAEGLGTFRAGQAALKAVKKKPAIALPQAAEAASTAGKVASVAGRASKVGEFGLQVTNLGVGLLAAHELSRHAKKPVPVKAPLVKGAVADAWTQAAKQIPRRKIVMSEPQKTEWNAVRSKASRNGVRILAGSSVLAGGLAGHHLAVRRARKLTEPQPVIKAFRVKPLNPSNVPRVVSLKARRTPGPPPLSKSLTWTGEICKIDTDKRQVFGWCSLSSVEGKPVVDLQGDFLPLEEIEKCAYRYVIESRKGGDMHKRVAKRDAPLQTSDLIESFVVTPDKLTGMGLAPDALPHGWWVGFKVNDEAQWSLVKSGHRAGFSIHGTGQRKAMAA